MKLLKLGGKITPIISLFIILSLMIGGPWGCSNKDVKSVKIGAIVPLTGPVSFIGKLIKEGMELAKEEVNSKSSEYGFKLEMVYGDNKGEVKEAVSIIQRNINIDKIKLFMVSPTPTCMAVAPIVDRTKTIMFAGSTHPYITDKSEYIFKTCASNAEENELLTKYATNQGIKSVGALFVEDDFGQSAIRYFKNHFNGTVLIEEPYKVSSTDFRHQILKIKRANPEAVLIQGYGIAFPVILKQIEELGIKSPILGNLGFANPPVQNILKTLRPDFVKKIIFSSPAFSQRFTKIIEQKFSKKPNLNQAFAYDFIKIIASEIKKNGLDIEKIKNSILQINNYSGAFKKIMFLPNGDSRSTVRLMKVEKGVIVPLD